MQSSNRATARLTPQEVRQLCHPRSKTIQHGLSTLAFGTMNCYSPLQAKNLPLSVLSLKHTESYAPSRASSFKELQDRSTPGVAYRKTNKEKKTIKHNSRHGQTVTSIKVAQIHHHKGGILQPE